MGMTLTEAIQSVLAGVPYQVLSTNRITFTLPAKNGGRGEVEVNVRGYGDRWSQQRKEYDLRFMKVEIYPDMMGGFSANFGLCPFEDGGKVARKLSPIEVLEHVTPDQIMEKLKSMIQATGDMKLKA